MDFITSVADHAERKKEWAARIENMQYFSYRTPFLNMDRRQNANLDPFDKYERFIEYTAEWMQGILTNDKEMKPAIHQSEFGGFRFKKQDLDKNWWKLAIRAGSGKKISGGLPNGTHTDKEEKGKIYDKFLPAYNALRESFQKRSFWQWFTNHAQYTAERDAMKAIRGVMMSLTGDDRAAFENNYSEYVGVIEQFEQKADEKLAAADKEAPEKEQLQVNEKDLAANVSKEPTMFELSDKIVNAETFHADYTARLNSLIDKVGDVTGMDKSALLPEDVRYNDVYMRLINRMGDDALNICYQYDALKTKGAKTSELAGVVRAGAQEMFKNAFKRLAPINLPLKEQIVIAQLITDQLMRSATPAYFEQNTYGKYADVYALRSTEFVKDAVIELAMEQKNIEMIKNADSVIEEVVEEMEIEVKNPLEESIFFDDVPSDENVQAFIVDEDVQDKELNRSINA